ncbi:hypothetical protein [Komagataeibacter sp. FNDCF1]|uniref:hypothetical protein n=1 Tax=Komagataeibacter sp. FNDCF1 TaxID=2878681 RepID=UPI001E45F9AD|nr:hypothetical protein [Komagataeibacter sp. FNDCF1]MCE2563536.1 hypothetical protein [Komagataeibacter sp. FNDCF1]
MDPKAVAEAYFNLCTRIEESQARVSDAAEALIPLVKKDDENARTALDSLRRAAVSMQAERTRAQYLWDLASGRNPPVPADDSPGPQQDTASRPHTFLDSLLADLMGSGPAA